MLCRFVVTSKLGRVLARDARRRAQDAASAATSRRTTSSSSGRCRRCCARWRARSTSRRSASSTPARCSRRTRSRWRSGSRSAAAARWSGALLGAWLINGAKSWLTAAFPSAWLYVLGGLFVVVTLFLPEGSSVVGGAASRAGSRPSARARKWRDAAGAAAGQQPRRRRRERPIRRDPRWTPEDDRLDADRRDVPSRRRARPPLALWVENVTVSFDGFKALERRHAACSNAASSAASSAPTAPARPR